MSFMIHKDCFIVHFRRLAGFLRINGQVNLHGPLRSESPLVRELDGFDEEQVRVGL